MAVHESKKSYAAYMRRRYASRRTDAIAALGGKCVRCGAQEELEFDHVDQKSKKEAVANLWRGSDEAIARELALCQLLCKSCHIEKTRPEVSALKTKPIVHGTLTAYVVKRCRCAVCRKAYAEKRKKYR